MKKETIQFNDVTIKDVVICESMKELKKQLQIGRNLIANFKNIADLIYHMEDNDIPVMFDTVSGNTKFYEDEKLSEFFEIAEFADLDKNSLKNKNTFRMMAMSYNIYGDKNNICFFDDCNKRYVLEVIKSSYSFGDDDATKN